MGSRSKAGALPPLVALALALTALLLQLGGAHAHGFMVEPKSRNLDRNWQYCPHCANAGGTWPVSGEGRLTWPKHRAPVGGLMGGRTGLG